MHRSCRVVAADAAGYLLESGQTVPADLKVWAAGIRASETFKDCGLQLNGAGQLMIGPNLLVKGEQSIFALGDCASSRPQGHGTTATAYGTGGEPAGAPPRPSSAGFAAPRQIGARISLP